MAPPRRGRGSAGLVPGLLAAVLLAGCAPGPRVAPGPPPVVYCYRTIGDPECYPRPQPGAERRLITVGPKHP